MRAGRYARAMADWSTAASLATALGTLVLALATFVAVRAANRAARVAETSMLIGIRPLLMHSRLGDPDQKIMWGDEHWAKLSGAGAVVEEIGGNVYMAMSLRNSGSGVAVIHGWHLSLEDLHDQHPHADPDAFRPQLRDLFIAGSDIGFWQAAIRDHDDPEYDRLLETVRSSRIFAMELLYSDNEGGQRMIGRFVLAPASEGRWLCSVANHWNLDRPDPRDSGPRA
jgi:hypothetical protein